MDMSDPATGELARSRRRRCRTTGPATSAFEGDIGHFFDVAGDDANVDWSISTFSANALYHFDTPHVTPYVTFGLGLERSAFEVKNPDVLALYQDLSATEFTFNFGGGVKYALNDRWQRPRRPAPLPGQRHRPRSLAALWRGHVQAEVSGQILASSSELSRSLSLADSNWLPAERAPVEITGWLGSALGRPAIGGG